MTGNVIDPIGATVHQSRPKKAASPMNREFVVATRVVSGLGALGALPTELVKLSAERIVVVADQGVSDVGLLEKILARIPDGLIVARCLVGPNPDVHTVELASEQARLARADVVLAVGGGSALGAAKAVAIRLTNPRRIDEYEGVGRVPNMPAPTVAVPTTAGSGSEVSTVLVLHEEGRAEELVVRSPGCEPRVAILDGTVLRNLPWAPLVFASLDALSHCIESTWTRRQTLFTESLALRAAQTIIDALPVAVEGVASGRNASGENDATLQLLLEASCAANMACGNSGLALVHALSTAPSVHIAHGLQNGILLPHVALFNAEVTTAAARVLVSQLDSLYARIGFTATFSGGAVGPEESEAMIAASTGHPFRKNNLREATDDELRSILRNAGAVVDRLKG
ncbi:iron-containing alcohol dehydrogenase family protein [Lacisediminihabitans profunda]|uniref:Iron-containing alcohol dehydrogenase n=1 Tax=Lacisediminihabitans profunda TaxID=2594790 RepID=A0A5C8UMP0_9MICO|nr:iron-containing alcohol dehydrogenase [Lacisediminihabitans profunda]TXN29470.1 iron-containing alcohol dehydrogenase [Lacisediminihabitans profunda]